MISQRGPLSSIRKYIFMTSILQQQNIEMLQRPRRNRKLSAIRDLVQETHLKPGNLISPLFIHEGAEEKIPVNSMPGIFRLSISAVLHEVEALYSLGVRSVILFPVISTEKKDPYGSEALKEKNILVRTIEAIKQKYPEVCVIADIALDPFTSHGHDGIVDVDGYVLNDETVEALVEMSRLMAEAGADVVAPSDMMDGRVFAIRKYLDMHGFSDVNILSYAAKYASAFYGPFRDALHSAPKFGDKKSYQMNPANVREALLECRLDEQEGADMLMIKPALSYLDVIAKVRQATDLPVGAFHVSGEYAMVKAAAQNGWIDGPRVMAECLLSIKRAGADFIITYAAHEMALLYK